MASASYFKRDDKFNNKPDYHAWKMSLDLTLKEQDVMDYVHGRITKHPSNARLPIRQSTRKVKSKLRRSSEILLISIWLHTSLI